MRIYETLPIYLAQVLCANFILSPLMSIFLSSKARLRSSSCTSSVRLLIFNIYIGVLLRISVNLCWNIKLAFVFMIHCNNIYSLLVFYKRKSTYINVFYFIVCFHIFKATQNYVYVTKVSKASIIASIQWECWRVLS